MESQADRPSPAREREPTAQIVLKAPVDWFERIDRWRLAQPSMLKPSRPATIRWIVHQFLLKQEKKKTTRRPGRRAGNK